MADGLPHQNGSHQRPELSATLVGLGLYLANFACLPGRREPDGMGGIPLDATGGHWSLRSDQIRNGAILTISQRIQTHRSHQRRDHDIIRNLEFRIRELPTISDR